MYTFGTNREWEQNVSAHPKQTNADTNTPALVQFQEEGGGAPLLSEFLVELEGFLKQFLLDRCVDVK